MIDRPPQRWRLGTLVRISSLVLLLIFCAGSEAIASDEKLDKKLFKAAKKGKIEKVEELLTAGANPDHRAIWVAHEGGHREVVRILMLKLHEQLVASPPHTAPDVSILRLAVYFAYEDVALELLERGERPNLRFSNGDTLLLVSAGNGSEEIVRALLTRGVEVNPSTDGRDFSFTLVEQGFTPLSSIDLYTAPKKAYSRNRTPLMLAAENGHTGIVQLLLNAGANPNVGHLHVTPLWLAVQEGHPRIAKLLLHHGAQVNIGFYLFRATETTETDRLGQFSRKEPVTVATTVSLMDITKDAVLDEMLRDAGAKKYKKCKHKSLEVIARRKSSHVQTMSWTDADGTLTKKKYQTMYVPEALDRFPDVMENCSEEFISFFAADFELGTSPR